MKGGIEGRNVGHRVSKEGKIKEDRRRGWRKEGRKQSREEGRKKERKEKRKERI